MLYFSIELTMEEFNYENTIPNVFNDCLVSIFIGIFFITSVRGIIYLRNEKLKIYMPTNLTATCLVKNEIAITL